MKSVFPRPLLLLAPLSAVACATLLGLGPPIDRPMSPHERHTKADVECVACHETIYDATDLSSFDVPKEKKCYECHKDQKAEKDCKYCHSVPEAPRTFVNRERHLIFNHKQHLEIERIGDDCKKCHTTLPEPGALSGLTPKMETCTACHEHETEYQNGECERCHQDLSRFPLRPLSRFEHQADFGTAHGGLARSRPDSCASCHDQQFCAECHARTVAVPVEVRWPERFDRQLIHRGDWVGRHALEEQRDPMLCARCHATTFCADCHTKAGVTTQSGLSLNPHGPGINEPGSREFHGTQARRDIVACASCHDQGAASNCVQCHRVGGIGGNPHPAGWSLRHPREEMVKNAMCLDCHR